MEDSGFALITGNICIGYMGVLYPEVKGPGHEADNLSPSIAEVKNGGAIPPLHDTPSWRGA
jgi:hypothetical protein